MWPLSCSNPYPMQSLCTLRNHCRQWPRNTRYQADATPYLGFHGQDGTSAGGALNAAGDAAGGAVLGADCALLYSGSPCRRGRSRTRSKPLPGRTDWSETWARRGAMPRWLAAEIKKGKKREDFAIDKSATKAKRRPAKKSRRKQKARESSDFTAAA